MTLTVAFASKSKRRIASSGISKNTVHMCITSIKLKSGWQSKFSGNTAHVYLGFAIVYCKNRPYLFIKTFEVNSCRVADEVFNGRISPTSVADGT